MELNIIFSITFLLLFTGYLFQFHKIIREKSSDGVSLQAYMVTLIASIIMTFSAETKFVGIIGVSEVILVSIGIYLIQSHRVIYKEKLSKSFFIALGFSFLMIHGVMQGIKSFQNKSYTQVSISGYFTWIVLDGLVIYLAENIFIILALLVSVAIYIYIIIDAYYKNKIYDSRRQELKRGEKYITLDNGEKVIWSSGGFYGSMLREQDDKRK